jgi:hypothetical protein
MMKQVVTKYINVCISDSPNDTDVDFGLKQRAI